MMKKTYIAFLFLLLAGCVQQPSTASPTEDISVSKQSLKLTKDGFADIFINQAYDLALFDETPDSRNPEVDFCFFAKSKKHPENLLNIFILYNEVAAIYVDDSGIKSYAGVSKGDSEKTVYAKHHNQTPEVYPSEYTKEPIIIYWNENNGDIGTRYDIEEGVVGNIMVGSDEALRLEEGCS